MAEEENSSKTLSRRVEYLRLGIMILLFGISLVLLFKIRSLNHEVELFRDHNTQLMNQLDSLALTLHKPAQATGDSTVFLSDFDIRKLQQYGLVNPAADLKRDLEQHPELIPQGGVLGGNMHFYDDLIYILTSKWAFAYYDDGHIAGHMLLEYEVGPHGDIHWTVLASALD